MSIKINTIDKISSFCGIDNVDINENFSDYNVIFANNGVGKTTITRAFSLLKDNNYKNIFSYQTVGLSKLPEITFVTNEGNIEIKDNKTSNKINFNVEIYNSEFIRKNAPFDESFSLKKIENNGAVLENTFLGEEQQSIKEFENKKSNKYKKIEEINEKISEKDKEIKSYEDRLNRKRSEISNEYIKIKIEDIKVSSFKFPKVPLSSEEQDSLKQLQNDVPNLKEAINKFNTLNKIDFFKIDFIEESKKIENDIFKFDREKLAINVSQNIKDHLNKVGADFIEHGIKFTKDDNKFCPFCRQKIDNGILDEYAKYFNKELQNFSQNSEKFSKDIDNEISKIQNNKDNILYTFENFHAFIEDFNEKKNDLDINLKLLIDILKNIKKLVDKKIGIKNLDIYKENIENLKEKYNKCTKIIGETDKILDNRKIQEKKFNNSKNKWKELTIKQTKFQTYEDQKNQNDLENRKKSFEDEVKKLISEIKKLENDIKIEQEKIKPDIKVINAYLKSLNLSKYTINSDYQLVLNKVDIKNKNANIILSDGEKTTLAFAYFLAKLKMNYDKNSLRDLVIVIDDPISSLDENRIYTTSYLVAKINQEIASENLVNNSEDKAQIFVLTHNGIFMSNLIRIIGRHSNYYILNRNNYTLKFEYKNNAAGYFDTFYTNLFKEIYNFSMEENLNDDDEDKALNYGNKIRILFESFMKVNFISKFVKNEYKYQNVFNSEVMKEITKKIRECNKDYNFYSDVFKNKINNDSSCVIENEDGLYKKLDRVVKGLHMDSHGSVANFYYNHKISLKEVQVFAKIIINVMISLNPHQTYFYLEACN